MLAIFTSMAQGVEIATADSAYAERNYAAAAELYQPLADSLGTADLYYNLGCAEYRLKHFPQAVLAFSRALHEEPHHADARYNLEVVRTRLTDRFSRPDEMVFISWFRSWVTGQSVAHWVEMSFLWLLFIFVGVALYAFLHKMWLRKLGFFFSLFCLLCAITTTVFAMVQRHRYYHCDDAVIFAEEIILHASPTTSSRKVAVIHEGTTVTLHETSEKDWRRVTLPDGREAWMKDKGYERIYNP